MILARLTRAIREQNWFAVVLEFVIVVLGVVIGFQVTAWNAERAERAREAYYLVQLEHGLNSVFEELEGAKREVDAYFNWITLFLDGVENADSEQAQRGSWGLNAITEVVSVNLLPAALSELIGAGELSLIRNRELRAELASIPQMQADSVSRMEQMARRQAPVAFEIARRFEIRLADVADFNRRAYSHQTLQFDFEDVARDNNFLRMINYAAHQNRVLKGHLDRRQTLIEAIRALVSAEIDSRRLR